MPLSSVVWPEAYCFCPVCPCIHVCVPKHCYHDIWRSIWQYIIGQRWMLHSLGSTGERLKSWWNKVCFKQHFLGLLARCLDEDFRVEVETSRYINVLVVLDEFLLAIISDQMNLFVVMSWEVLVGFSPDLIWDRDECIKSWCQKVKVQGHVGITCWNCHCTGRGIQYSTYRVELHFLVYIFHNM